MRCKACEQVCQSKLHLIAVYDEMEKRLERKHGKDDEMIKSFIDLAEQSPAYDALVERGLVLGAAARTWKEVSEMYERYHVPKKELPPMGAPFSKISVVRDDALHELRPMRGCLHLRRA